MSKKKQGFVFGALILMLSNIVVKAIGAFFKIPLSNAIGATAMGYFSSAYSIYSMCFLISTAGLPVAISRMIASAGAKGRTREVDAIYRISLLIFMLIGTAVTAALFFFSDAIAAVPAKPELSVCIKAISPIMFFICLVSCIRGYFQGHQNMVPTAVSQVIEAIGNLALGLTAGIFATKKGYSPAVVAAFALGGVTLGVVISAVYMAFAKWVSDRDRESGVISEGNAPNRRALAKQLISIAIPITISSSVMSLTSVIDSMLAVGRLDHCVGTTFLNLDAETPFSMTLYGAYMARAVTLFNLPTTIVYPFAISIIPAISSADSTGDKTTLKKTMDFTFRIVSCICLPCAFGLACLSKPIIDLLFADEAIALRMDGSVLFSNATAGAMLSILACAIVFSGMISVSGAMLQAYGHEKKSILSTCCGVLMKAVSVYFLAAIPEIGPYGIPLSTLLCYLVMFSFNMFFLSRYVNYRLSFRAILLKPLISAALCGLVAIGAHLALSAVLSPKIATVGAIGAAAIVYVLALFFSGGFQKDDVLMLPKGQAVLRLLLKLRLVKP